MEKRKGNTEETRRGMRLFSQFHQKPVGKLKKFFSKTPLCKTPVQYIIVTCYSVYNGLRRAKSLGPAVPRRLRPFTNCLPIVCQC